MFDGISLNDIMVAVGCVVTFCLGFIGGLLS